MDKARAKDKARAVDKDKARAKDAGKARVAAKGGDKDRPRDAATARAEKARPGGEAECAECSTRPSKRPESSGKPGLPGLERVFVGATDRALDKAAPKKIRRIKSHAVDRTKQRY